MDLNFEHVGGERRRADRLFRLVEQLRRRRILTARQLADTLEVSLRTVYRDINALNARGIRIKGTGGQGYTLDRLALLPPLHLEDEEGEAIVLGARMAAAWTDPTLGAAAHSALEKIEAVLPDASAAVLAHIPLYAPTGPWARLATDGLAPLRQCIANRRKVRFGYTRSDQRQSRRVVRPLGLHFWGRAWTLASWCEMRRDYRSFRVDRIVEIEPLDIQWPASDRTELSGYLAEKRKQTAVRGMSGLGP